MGCSSSAGTTPSPTPARRLQSGPRADGPRPIPAIYLPRTITSAYDSIVRDCSTIAVPPNLLPVVCLGRESFPIITIHFPDLAVLPVIAGSFIGCGRVLCISQADFFQPSVLSQRDTRCLLENAVCWLTASRRSETVVSVVGFDSAYAPIVTSSMSALG
jgi:hypothetical protein